MIFYIDYAKRYINASWHNIEAYVYQSSKWVKFSEKSTATTPTVTSSSIFYNEGNEYSSVTGGWTASGYSCGSYGIQTAEKASSCLYAYGRYANPDGIFSIIGTANKVDITNINTLKANMSIIGDIGVVRIGIVTSKNITNVTAASPIVYELGDYTLSLDVSKYSGEYYIIAYAYGTSAYGHRPTGKFTKIWGT
jgi:hypothetical protein